MTNKKIKTILISILLAIFFVYIFFPRTLVKEVSIGKIQDFFNQTNTGFVVQAESLSSYWLTGIQAKNFQIANQNNLKDPLKINEITVRVSILPLLIGNININSHIKIEQGEGTVFISLSLFDLISSKLNINKVEADFSNFKLDDFFKQLIYFLSNRNDPNFALIAPLIAESSFGGFLNGNIDYSNSSHYLSKANLKIKNAFLDLNNATLDIPKQIFTDANVDIEYGDSSLVVKKDTLFASQGIRFAATGTIKNEKSQFINMKVKILLSGQIEKNFGFLLPQLLKCPASAMVGGSLDVNLMGTTDKLVCQ